MLYHTTKNGETNVKEVGVSQHICSRCVPYLKAANVKYNTSWIQGRTDNWDNPWNEWDTVQDPYEKKLPKQVQE